MGGQPNALTASVLIHGEAQEQVWTFWGGEEENIFRLHGFEPPVHTTHCLVTVVTTLHRLQNFWGLVMKSLRTLATDFVDRS